MILQPLLALAALVAIVPLVPPQDVEPATKGPAPQALYLILSGDVLAVQVIHAVVKEHPYKIVPRDQVTHRVRLMGPEGVTLATVELDLSAVCLDPGHVGQPPHILGDSLIGHRILTLASVPHLPGLQAVRIERPGVDQKGRPNWQLMGRLNAADLTTLLNTERR